MDDQTVDMRRQHETEDAEAASRRPRRGLRRILGFTIGFIVLIGLGVAGFRYWDESRHFESTDDAFIDANSTQMAPRIAGQVTQLLFSDNQHVVAGQILVQIDPRDMQAKLDQATAQKISAEASLQQAQAQVTVQRAALDQAKANVGVSEADRLQARQDYDRFRQINPSAVSRQQIDTATATFHSSDAKLQASRQTVEGAQAQVQAAEAQVLAAQASVKQAEANVETARLQLSYCTIVAPVTGTVTHRTVDAGNYVSAGQPLFALVQDDRWVTANFKETQLAEIRPGQGVDVSIDAVSSGPFRGHVDSFQTGTGSVFSTLPAENATGNYVKIVQRLPVKILLDDERLRHLILMPGMSVVPSVRVR